MPDPTFAPKNLSRWTLVCHGPGQSNLDSLNEKIDENHLGAIICCDSEMRGRWEDYIEVRDDVDVSVGVAKGGMLATELDPLSRYLPMFFSGIMVALSSRRLATELFLGQAQGQT
jgi:hypothetical protein